MCANLQSIENSLLLTKTFLVEIISKHWCFSSYHMFSFSEILLLFPHSFTTDIFYLAHKMNKWIHSEYSKREHNRHFHIIQIVFDYLLQIFFCILFYFYFYMLCVSLVYGLYLSVIQNHCNHNGNKSVRVDFYSNHVLIEFTFTTYL